MMYYLDYIFLALSVSVVTFFAFKGDSLLRKYLHTMNVLNVKADRISASIMRLSDTLGDLDLKISEDEVVRLKRKVLKELRGERELFESELMNKVKEENKELKNHMLEHIEFRMNLVEEAKPVVKDAHVIKEKKSNDKKVKEIISTIREKNGE